MSATSAAFEEWSPRANRGPDAAPGSTEPLALGARGRSRRAFQRVPALLSSERCPFESEDGRRCEE